MLARLRTKLKASSLFYALLIALLIAVMSTAFIGLVFYNKLLAQLDEQAARLQLNAKSGFQLLLAEERETVSPTYYDLFEESTDSVFLKKSQWGLYEVACAQAFETTFQGKKEHTEIALLGTTPNQVNQSALFLLDENKPLALCGNTRLEGTVYHPRAGIRVGNVSGQSYSGQQLVYGKKKISKTKLPELSRNLFDKQLKQFDLKKGRHLVSLGDSIARSFLDEPLIIKDSIIYVKNQKITGHITLVADSLIYFGKDAQVENITAYAPTIFFEAGFEGNVQAFATSKMQVSENCKLNYPSALCLLNTVPSTIASSCTIGAQSIVEGSVLVRNSKNRNKAPILKIDKEAIIKGEVYAETKVQLDGRVEGHMSCNGFLLRAGTSLYDNHLLNAEIVYPARSEYYLTSFMWKGERKREVLKWVE